MSNLNLNEKMVEAYIENTHISSGAKSVLETLDICDIEVVYNYGCVAGASGFIYYSETESFFNDHADEILDLFEEQKINLDLENFTYSRNNFTWFFVEWVVLDLISWIETYIDEEAE